MRNMPTPRRARAANPPTAPPTIAAIGVPDELAAGEDVPSAGAVVAAPPPVPPPPPLVEIVLLVAGFEVEVDELDELDELDDVDEVPLPFEVALVRVTTSGLKVRPSFSPLKVVEASCHVVTVTLSQK
jgi:hypothetical protein